MPLTKALSAAVATVGLALMVTVSAAGTIDLGSPLFAVPRFVISPTQLSRTQPTQVRMLASEQYRTKDGTHVPALRELEVKGDRNLSLDLEGVPVCMPSGYEPRGSIAETCRDALVGSGKVTVEVAFPEQPVMWIQGKLGLYNSGRGRNGQRLLADAFLPAPVTGELVVPITISRVDQGPFGWRAKAEVPKIAGGSGSIFGFSVRIGKRFLRATCADGSLELSAVSTFVDGQKLGGRVVRTCTVAKADARQ